MGTQIGRGRGRLYRIGSEQFVDAINYQIYEDLAQEPTHWWGELTFTNVMNINNSDRYIIELEDGRKGACHLKKLINRVVRGVPPRYTYHFTGMSPLE